MTMKTGICFLSDIPLSLFRSFHIFIFVYKNQQYNFVFVVCAHKLPYLSFLRVYQRGWGNNPIRPDPPRLQRRYSERRYYHPHSSTASTQVQYSVRISSHVAALSFTPNRPFHYLTGRLDWIIPSTRRDRSDVLCKFLVILYRIRSH